MKKSIFNTANIFEKLKIVEPMLQALHAGVVFEVPELSARDTLVLDPRYHPAKERSMESKDRQARLLHDLASIELQALELAIRTLVDFPEAPKQFKAELEKIALSEASHLQLCLDGLSDLNAQWGAYPIHLALWGAVSHEDSLLDRILIVHRYLEGSGLDAGAALLRRLAGVSGSDKTQKIMQTIHDDEIDHVLFGSRWYQKICKAQLLDPDLDFAERIQKLRAILPRRNEKIEIETRYKAGFSISEVQTLSALRESFLRPQI